MHLFDVQRVAHVLASRAAGKRCLCVAIEGAGGYGKSTLARELAAAAYATVIHGDDLYCVMDIGVHAALTPEEGYRRNFDWQRWRDQLLRPLARGVPANYQRYDWERNMLGSGRRSMPAASS